MKLSISKTIFAAGILSQERFASFNKAEFLLL
jgi:hypothetical protein